MAIMPPRMSRNGLSNIYTTTRKRSTPNRQPQIHIPAPTNDSKQTENSVLVIS